MIEDKGGYHDIDRKLYNVTYARHNMKPSQESLNALHAIQETPWQINEDVMKFIDWLQSKGKNSPMGFAYNDAPRVKLSPEEWANLTPKERRDIYTEKKERASKLGKRSAIANRIRIAQDLRVHDEFYQPQFFDFRGRVYPMNTEFNNQADHFAKGMMQFRNGMKLGESGLRQLKLHTANTWGQDKLQLDDREKYVDDRQDLILSISESYEVASEECAKADEPIAFYAAVVDLANAIRSKDPKEHVSHIPCAVDGTCNGLQILSLLGHDKIGADKTNCTANPIRQDVYMEVANIALDLVNTDLNSTETIDCPNVDGETVELQVSEIASIWKDHLGNPNGRRKAVKRAIMTTAYGVSEFSMGKNLLSDGIVDKLSIPDALASNLDINKLKGVFAAYFRDKIVEARKGAISQAVLIMDYFTHVARTLSENGVDMTWTTPDGLEVTQSYRKQDIQRYKSAELGQLVIKKVTNTLNSKKCGSGAAPQVVHSLDAAMLRTTCMEMVKKGYTDLCMIHDSYGTHAGAIDVLHETLRKVAVDMFSGNWLLDSFHKEQIKHDIPLMSPPSQGDLNVSEEIPNSVYFFS
jgi:DNA-directed RNA polymerase